MAALCETCLFGGIDITTQLTTCGFIDIYISALCAVEEVGADNVNGVLIVLGLLGLLPKLAGESLDQIEDRVRAIPSVLRYLKESSIRHLPAFGYSASTTCTLVPTPRNKYVIHVPQFARIIGIYL
jgi:hypothetical protein